MPFAVRDWEGEGGVGKGGGVDERQINARALTSSGPFRVQGLGFRA
jgi:hypothetical protein